MSDIGCGPVLAVSPMTTIQSLKTTRPDDSSPGGAMPGPIEQKLRLLKRDTLLLVALYNTLETAIRGWIRERETTRVGIIDPCMPRLSCLHADGTHPGNGNDACKRATDSDGNESHALQSVGTL